MKHSIPLTRAEWLVLIATGCGMATLVASVCLIIKVIDKIWQTWDTIIITALTRNRSRG